MIRLIKSKPFFAVLVLSFALNCLKAQHPNIGGFNVYYGDLHNHCNFSEGSGTVDEAFRHAHKIAGLDFFGLSDHAELLSDDEWKTMKRKANYYNIENEFVTLWGFEWSSVIYGHVNIMGSDNFCSSLNLSTFTFTNLLKWINENECIAFFNHPGYSVLTDNEFNHFNNTPSERFVGMELWNGSEGFNQYFYNNGYFSNDGGLSYFDEAIHRGWYIGAWGGDDVHDENWGSNPFNVAVLADGLTRNELRDALKSRRFYSTLDKNLEMSFKLNGSEMGSRIASGNYQGEIHLHDADHEFFTSVKIFRNGLLSEVYEIFDTLPVIRFVANTADDDYFYIIARQQDGDEAVSSPIYISSSVPVNTIPYVEIIYPSDNQYLSPGTLEIQADAYDTDGYIKRVSFYVNNQYIGTDTEPPYSTVFNANSGGFYSLQAVAFDDKNTASWSHLSGFYINGTSLTDNYLIRPEAKIVLYYRNNRPVVYIEGLSMPEAIQVIDLTGRVIAEFSINPYEHIELSNFLMKGFYLVSLKNQPAINAIKMMVP